MVTQNLTVARGDTLTLNLEFTQDFVPIDITGYTIFFTVKEKDTDPDSSAIVAKTVTVHTDPTNGMTAIVVPPNETYSLVGTYHYDIQSKDTSDNIKTPMMGRITFTRDITRRTA